MQQNSSMTEQELLTDLLHSERALIKEYASNCSEAGCMDLRSLLINCMSEVSNDQFAVFDQMRRRDLYKTKPAKGQDVQTAISEMNSLESRTW